MLNATWKKVLKDCADPRRASEFLERLSAMNRVDLKSWDRESASKLAAFFSGSQALGEMLIDHADWLNHSLAPEFLQRPRRKQGLAKEIKTLVEEALKTESYQSALDRLREFKQREMIRIAIRDLSRSSNAREITQEISDVADVCLDAAYRLCYQQLASRLGHPYHQEPDGRWTPTLFCVLGLGKLGGQDLNYSSDIDVMCLYSEEGYVFKNPPKKSTKSGDALTNHQFFVRLSESFVTEVSRRSNSGGWLYRVDLRLRPEGQSGPLARSLPSMENYYAQWGQTFERMMLIKTRRVAGEESLAAEFLEMIQPFRYPRSIGNNIPNEIATMKQRIEREVVKSGELDRNVKLGRGGIREIEFIAQTLQLLHGGRIPFLQNHQTLPTLEKLGQYDLLDESDVGRLRESYLFLRDVEHRLQMEENLQTHTIPEDKTARERLARLMGFQSWKSFETVRTRHTKNVRQVFDRLFHSLTTDSEYDLPRDFDLGEQEWLTLLKNHGFREPENAFRMVRNFIQGPGYVHVSPRTVELGTRLIIRFLEKCPSKEHLRNIAKNSAILSDPDRVLIRLDSYVGAYGSRSMVYESWNANASIYELMLLLFDRSEFLAELAIKEPDLVDDLTLSGLLNRKKDAAETLKDLRYGLKEKDQRAWLRRYFQTEFMRLGLRHILGMADWEQNARELSALAQACLQYSLEVVLRKHKLKKNPFAIIGLGKFGGMELDYGSDLDILFVAPRGTKNLSALQKVAVEMMDLLSAKTEDGRLFETDARLRPDGEAGLLVNTLDAYEEYYQKRAQLWEIQTLGRTRFLAGEEKVGQAFERLAVQLTDFSKPDSSLAAFSRDWKAEIARMRMRIETERTPAGKDHLAIKTGRGGLIDAEFLAQACCLEKGWHIPDTLTALEEARKQQALSPRNAKGLIDNYRQLRRVESILRRWSFEGETALPDSPAPLYRVAIRCGFPSTDRFMAHLEKCRNAIRKVYNAYFPKVH